MDDRRARREQCRLLADRLILEYAGAVAPGQVLAAVFRAQHSLAGPSGLSMAAKMDICESSARRVLTVSAVGIIDRQVALEPLVLAGGEEGAADLASQGPSGATAWSPLIGWEP